MPKLYTTSLLTFSKFSYTLSRKSRRREGGWYRYSPYKQDASDLLKTDELPERVMHRRFAAIETNDEKAIIRFADRYGYLGFDVLLHGLQRGQIAVGEALNRWKREISELSTLIKLWDYVIGGDTTKLENHVAWKDDNVVITLPSSGKEVTRYEIVHKLKETGDMF